MNDLPNTEEQGAATRKNWREFLARRANDAANVIADMIPLIDEDAVLDEVMRIRFDLLRVRDHYQGE